MSSGQLVVGIDYSMSSPSICIHEADSWSIDNCKFFFLTQKKKHIMRTQRFIGELHREYLTSEHRFDNISGWAVSHIPQCSKVFIEDYAFAAKGVVFHIGECAGVLKHKLWSLSIGIRAFSPSAIKKLATGKGNANKIEMHSAFLSETGLDLQKWISCDIGDSPMSDVIDSYYVAKAGFFSLQGTL